MDLATVSPKYQVVIPKRVREQFGLSPGQQLQVMALPGRIEQVASQPPVARVDFCVGRTPSKGRLTACERRESRRGFLWLD